MARRKPSLPPWSTIVYCPSGRHSLESTRDACKAQDLAWKTEGCSSCKAESTKEPK